MSKLGQLAQAAEEATDQFAAAVDAAAEAEAAYLRAYHIAFAQTSPLDSDTKRRSTAEQVAFEERIGSKRAEWAVERCKALMRTRLATLSAAQTQFKAVEKMAG